MKTEVKLQGDWTKVEKKINNLMKTYDEVEMIVNQIAIEQTEKLKNDILSQRMGWTPLQPSTLERKKRLGQDSRIMIATGSLIDAIKPQRLKTGFWSVGIDKSETNSKGDNIAKIAEGHEYGTKNRPARPIFRKVTKNMKDVIRYRVGKFLQNKVKI